MSVKFENKEAIGFDVNDNRYQLSIKGFDGRVEIDQYDTLCAHKSGLTVRIKTVDADAIWEMKNQKVTQ